MIEKQPMTADDAETRLRDATKQFEQAKASNRAEQIEIAKKMMEDAFNELARLRK